MTRDQRQRGNDCVLMFGLVIVVALACIGVASCVWMMGRA